MLVRFLVINGCGRYSAQRSVPVHEVEGLKDETYISSSEYGTFAVAHGKISLPQIITLPDVGVSRAPISY